MKRLSKTKRNGEFEPGHKGYQFLKSKVSFFTAESFFEEYEYPGKPLKQSDLKAM